MKPKTKSKLIKNKEINKPKDIIFISFLLALILPLEVLFYYV